MGLAKLMWCRGYNLRLLGVAFIILVTFSDHDVQAARKGNCGLKCFTWQKCMGQVSGSDARPGEQGNTGIIILTKCDQGKCDCPKVLAEAKEKKAQKLRDKTSTTPPPSRTKSSRTSNRGSSSSRFRPIIRNNLRSRLSGRKTTTTTTTTTTRRPLLRGKLASRFKPGRPRSVSDLRAKAKAEAESKPDPVKTESKTAKRFQFPKRTVFGFSNNKQIQKEVDSSTTSAPIPKRTVIGFSNDKPIQVEFDSATTSAPVDVNTDGDSKDKPFIVMATSVSSSFSSSVGRAERRADRRVGRKSDVTMTKARRKGTINSSRKDRISVFKRFFRKPHFLHRF